MALDCIRGGAMRLSHSDLTYLGEVARMIPDTAHDSAYITPTFSKYRTRLIDQPLEASH